MAGLSCLQVSTPLIGPPHSGRFSDCHKLRIVTVRRRRHGRNLTTPSAALDAPRAGSGRALAESCLDRGRPMLFARFWPRITAISPPPGRSHARRHRRCSASGRSRRSCTHAGNTELHRALFALYLSRRIHVRALASYATNTGCSDSARSCACRTTGAPSLSVAHSRQDALRFNAHVWCSSFPRPISAARLTPLATRRVRPLLAASSFSGPADLVLETALSPLVLAISSPRHVLFALERSEAREVDAPPTRSRARLGNWGSSPRSSRILCRPHEVGKSFVLAAPHSAPGLRATRRF